MEKRSTIIIGNGLGMSLDPDYFRLQPALDSIWHDPNCLSDEQKKLIQNCIKATGTNIVPNGEEDLYYLHLVANACELLDVIANHDDAWLTNLGKDFPFVTRRFLTDTAWYFHHHDYFLPDTFLAPLFEFITYTNSSVATLNYDNLLYQKMIEVEILAGYDGCLLDGFHVHRTPGFSPENLIRKYDHDFGYYLHLHGSPLFIGDDLIQKQLQGSATNIPTKHLVLSHFRHKPTIIDASLLLSTYWRYFNLSLQESEKIYILGCSGLDKHLNQVIEAQTAGKKVQIIEWVGAGDEEKRLEFWREEIPTSEIDLMQMDNILEFNEWTLE